VCGCCRKAFLSENKGFSMSGRKFSFTLRFTNKYNDYDYPEVNDIFGNYVHVDYDDDKFYLFTQKATTKAHLSKLSKWKVAFERLYDYGWNGSSDYMLINIPTDDLDLGRKLKIFFDNNREQIEDLANTDHSRQHGLIIRYHSGIMVEFSGVDLRLKRNIDYDVYELKMRLLLIDAILDYCDSRSIDDVKDETWDDFREFVRDRRELRSYFRI